MFHWMQPPTISVDYMQQELQVVLGLLHQVPRLKHSIVHSVIVNPTFNVQFVPDISLHGPENILFQYLTV